MNIGGFFAILDDVAATLDDVAVMSKVAAKKTAGILGDDLAVNANLSANFASDREIPVLLAIAKGSCLNKLIILPLAFLLSAFAPWLIAPILILGAFYLSFEGAEKIVHTFVAWRSKEHPAPHGDVEEANEQQKIKQAIATDFILSIEIIILALGTVSDEPLMVRIGVTTIIAFLATIAVYGLVALLVRMDDFGLYLVSKSENKNWLKQLGTLLILSLPKIIKALTIIGVIAMLLVAGGIFTHNVETLHHLSWANSFVGEMLLGFIAGLFIVALMKVKTFFVKG